VKRFQRSTGGVCRKSGLIALSAVVSLATRYAGAADIGYQPLIELLICGTVLATSLVAAFDSRNYLTLELSLVKTSCALELIPNQQHSKTGVGPRWTRG
jgi:hypothetical protein